jgi:hypothetical protein
MVKVRTSRLRLNVWSANSNLLTSLDDAAELAGPFESGPACREPELRSDLRRRNLRRRYDCRILHPRNAIGDLNATIDLFVRSAKFQQIIHVEKDLFTIEGTLPDLNDQSKTIVLLRSCRYPTTKRQPFILAIQVGVLARMMLGMHLFEEHRWARPSQ